MTYVLVALLIGVLVALLVRHVRRPKGRPLDYDGPLPSAPRPVDRVTDRPQAGPRNPVP